MENNNCCINRYRKDKRSIESKINLQKRLSRACGQLNGISKMIEEDRYCEDVLIQLSAVISALKSFGNVLLKDHLQTCVSDKIKQGDSEVISEVMEIIKKLQ